VTFDPDSVDAAQAAIDAFVASAGADPAAITTLGILDNADLAA
jgi:hypothetical protein